jgi:uncharacterized protein YbjT (DUF2867 family)
MTDRPCFVTGGSSQVGSWLVPKLVEGSWRVHLVSRGERARTDYGPKATWHSVDLSDAGASLPDVDASVLFHTADIWLLIPWIEVFHARGVRRIIAFSSTSRFTKKSSASVYEQDVVDRLERGEAVAAERCEGLGVALTILRPTIIYGGKLGNRTVMDMGRIIQRLGAFPLFGPAKGLRQPVHADDLATACLQSVDCEAAFGKAYNLGGGERLDYTEFVCRIFAALGRRPRLIRVPMLAFQIAVKLAHFHPRYRHLTTSMAARMQQDLVFDIDDAVRDFAYAPRGFRPEVDEVRPLAAAKIGP